MDRINRNGLAMLGCGKMGSAMLEGWLSQGVLPGSVYALDPNPSTWLQHTGAHINDKLPPAPAALIIAVKPQIMEAALPQIAHVGGADTVVISVAAGVALDQLETAFGPATPIVRAMPNTPAAIGKGITAMVGNRFAGPQALELAENLLSAVGQVLRLQDESQMDAVTAVSGSGPAYVFHLIETLAAAGQAEGLPAKTALHLARATVAGAGALAEKSDQAPGELRANVTSPGGTTQAGLEILMDERAGLPPLMRATVAAAAHRSRELANG